ncbi:solute carrier family 23 member 1-like isoform X2 [Actinia tenebrosa]|nr:solute carrier family 23 member 1-like isoform X2 [Actinia tenebrosa]
MGGLSYLINENPPWYICILLGFQHYLTMLGANLAVPFALSEKMCFANNHLAISEVMSTVFFTSGVSTILQTTFGVRLPIVQGSTFTFLAPAVAILRQPKFLCPVYNSTENSTMGYDKDVWKPRMLEIQGAIMVSSLFQVLVGFSGLMGFLMHFIGPVSIAPTIILIGLSLFEVAAGKAGTHWGISMTTIVLIVIFSQYMQGINLRIPAYSRDRGCYVAKYPLFRLFPIILAICTSWLIALIVTAAGGFPDDPELPQYMARTDARIKVLREAEWFRVPYPGQWGLPTVSAAAVLGMLSGVVASIVESIGDYYACARMSGAPPPPTHAINRGIGMEGIGCIITGAWGTGSGTTSYSENIGAIGITKVGSLRVIQVAGCVAIVMGVVGKIGALFTSIPDPVVGGVFMVMFGMITAVGMSNLQYVDMTAARNMFIVGVSVVFGMALPFYLKTHENAIQTGYEEVDQIITILLSTNIAVGGMLALFLDNTIPGTKEERGLIAWKHHLIPDEDEDDDYEVATIHVYDLPFCLKRLGYNEISRYIPFLPYYHPVSHDGACHVAAATNVAMETGESTKRDLALEEGKNSYAVQPNTITEDPEDTTSF